MKVNSIYTTPPTIPFKGNFSHKINPIKKSAQFFEVTGIVAMTSIPMFVFVYLQNIFKKSFQNKIAKNHRNNNL